MNKKEPTKEQIDLELSMYGNDKPKPKHKEALANLRDYMAKRGLIKKPLPVAKPESGEKQ